MSAIGVPEADILKLGGWETDYAMKSVYRHSMMEKEENTKREAAKHSFFLADFMTKNFINLIKYS